MPNHIPDPRAGRRGGNRLAGAVSINRHFVRHYFEMVLVMFAGMAVLGLPAGFALGAVGSGWTDLREESPALMLLLMAFTMTAPMAAWMRYRGHSTRANAEMAASMIVPTLAVITLHGIGLIADAGTLLLVEHVLMLAAMFAVMRARPREYAGHHHAHHAPATA